MTHRGPFQPLPFCDSEVEGGFTGAELWVRRSPGSCPAAQPLQSADRPGSGDFAGLYAAERARTVM